MSTPASPPRLARWILTRALAGPARSAIVGDIEEEFAGFVAPRLGARAARRWYWRQTILSIAACLRGPDAPQPARVPETYAPARYDFDVNSAGSIVGIDIAPALVWTTTRSAAAESARDTPHWTSEVPAGRGSFA